METRLKARTAILLSLLVVTAASYYRLKIAGPGPDETPVWDEPGRAAPILTAAVWPEQALNVTDAGTTNYPGNIIDHNGNLGRFVGHLQNICDAWTTDLGIDLHIVAGDLETGSVEKASTEIFERRRIGSAHPNGGLLILLDGNSGHARIEVSYDLEASLPDAFIGRLVEDQLVPYAASKMAGMAVMDVAQYLKDFVFMQAAVGNLPDPQLAKASNEYQEKLAYFSGGAGASVDVNDLLRRIEEIQPVSSERASAYAPGNTPELSMEAYKRVLKDMVPNPDLELYTPATRVLKASYPYAPFEVAERLKRLEQSTPLRTVRQGELAVITSDDPVRGFVPLLLRKEDEAWQIDLAETWKNLFFDHNGNYYQKNNNHPYTFGLDQFGRGWKYHIDALDLHGRSLSELIRTLNVREDALAHFELAELLFRNGFAALAALNHYEEAVSLAPMDPLFRSTLADRYTYLGFSDLAIPHLAQLGSVGQVRLAQAYSHTGEFELVEQTAKEILERNPYSYHAYAWLDYALKQQQKTNTATSEKLEELLKDPQQKMRYVRFGFRPEKPVYNNREPTDVNGTKVFGHSEFSVFMTNFSERPIVIESVLLYTLGTDKTGGLGNIMDYWVYPDKRRTLQAGQTIKFNKTWGFTRKVRDQRLSYRFNVCWRGAGERAMQCEAQILHLSTMESALSVD